MTAPHPQHPGDKTLALISLGCSKNLVDSEILLGFATQAGWRIVEDPGEARLIVVNTCGFIAPAKEESIDTILEMGEFKANGNCETLVVAGCMAQRYGEELAESLPEVDAFVGTGELPAFADILNGSAGRRLLVGAQSFPMRAHHPRVLATPFYTANVKLAEGCSSVCAFCAIPKIRGPQISRPADDILNEVDNLLDMGVRELCLIAQDLSAYGEDLHDGASLAALLREPRLVEGSHWVRLHYLYPKRVTAPLLGAMRAAPAVLPYIDMPIQHIDNDVLAAMRRKDDEAATRAAVERVKHLYPEAALRSTLLLGHPGETDAAFQKVYDYVAEGHFDHLGVFAYSPEEGTVSATLNDSIPDAVKAERVDAIMALQRDISADKLAERIGQTVEVLVTGPSPEHELLTAGRTVFQAADIDGVTYLIDGADDVEIGAIRQARIVASHDYDLEAELL